MILSLPPPPPDEDDDDEDDCNLEKVMVTMGRPNNTGTVTSSMLLSLS